VAGGDRALNLAVERLDSGLDELDDYGPLEDGDEDGEGMNRERWLMALVCCRP